MRKPEDCISLDKLKTLVSYDPETGLFTYLGNKKGTLNEGGYMETTFDKKKYALHRLAWFYVYGVWPNQIDHINHIRDDNRIENLRDVTNKENSKNMSLAKNSKSKVTGVCWHALSGRWVSYIYVDGKKKSLGYYHNKKMAIKARMKANKKYGFHENHGASNERTS